MNAVRTRYPDEFEVGRLWDVSRRDREISESFPLAERSIQITTKAKVWAFPVWVFSGDHKRLVTDKPVKVVVYEDDGSSFAECEGLHVYAMGASEEEAIDDLHHQVIHFYSHYTGLSDDEVIGEAAKLRRLYLEHFKQT